MSEETLKQLSKEEMSKEGRRASSSNAKFKEEQEVIRKPCPRRYGKEIKENSKIRQTESNHQTVELPEVSAKYGEGQRRGPQQKQDHPEDMAE